MVSRTAMSRPASASRTPTTFTRRDFAGLLRLRSRTHPRSRFRFGLGATFGFGFRFGFGELASSSGLACALLVLDACPRRVLGFALGLRPGGRLRGSFSFGLKAR